MSKVNKSPAHGSVLSARGCVFAVGMLSVLPFHAALAQSADGGGWVQFPPRPRADLAAPAPRPAPLATQTPEAATAPEAASAPQRKKTPVAAAAAAATATSLARDGWISFPIRPTQPADIKTEPAAAVAQPVPVQDFPSQGLTGSPLVLPKEATQVAAPMVAEPAVPASPVEVSTPKPIAKAANAQARPAMPPEKAPNGRILGFVFKGNTRIKDVQLLTSVKALIGMPINSGNLTKVVETVSAAYRNHGLLATAELPQQDLTEGWVQVNVLEARFAGATVSDPTGQLANTKLPVAIVEHAQPKGDVVSLDALDKATMLLADVPGVQTSVSLRPGESVGETEAVVTVSEGKRIEAMVGIDNAGSRATGEVRETAKLVVNNPLHMGDSVGLQVLHSEGLNYQRLNYSVPVGDAGWRVGANTSSMNYKLITQEFSGLDARGPSKSTGLDLTVPLVRTFDQNTSLLFAYDSKKFRNEFLDTVTSDYQGSSFSALLESVTQDAARGAETSLSAQLVAGNIDLSNSTANHIAQDAQTVQTAGHYQKIKLSATRKQAINADNTVVASLQSQWANKNLDGSEKFYLGGAQGIRAYPTSEAGGSMGNLVSLEWQHHFEVQKNRWTLASFYDWGNITVNKNNGFEKDATQNSPNKYSLSGYGFWLGASLPGSKGLTNVRLTWARRAGANPNANLLGKDQDGSYTKNRVRLNLSHAF